ncbi:MAG: IPT/TIG domain-containing protein [Persicimonas sp.]
MSSEPLRPTTLRLPGALLTALCLSLVLFGLGCSDDTDGGGELGDVGGEDTAVDADIEPDAGPSRDTDAAGDTRRPRDTDNDWDWDIGGEDASVGPFELAEIVPPSGPVEGGNRVRILGSGFERDTRVFFGSSEMDVDVTTEQMLGLVPPASGPGPVTVKAISPGGETRTLVDGYEYVEGLQIDSVSPSRVPTTGGVEVAIRGSGFGPDSAVSFSGEPALRTRFVDEELLRVVTPPRRRGLVDVRVTTRNDSKVGERALEYFEPLEVGQIRPASGPTAGGQTVTVEGSGFRSDMSFSFGGGPADVINVDPQASSAELRAPAHTAGLVDVVAETSQDSAIMADAYLYRDTDTPELAAISPGFGPASGGTEVELRGWGFDASGLEISFGGQAATVVDRGPSFARVETPAGTPGAVDVVMSDASGELDRLDDGFDYREDVWIDDVSPSEGPSDGGTEVTLEGSGLASVDRVVFGGLDAAFTVDSDTQITATTPAHSAGQVDLVVEREGVEATFRDGFLYTEQLEVWGFTPIRGSVAGETYVEVRGRGFYGTVAAFFDEEPATGVQRIDRNNLRLYTPAHPSGEAKVRVETNESSAEAPYEYEYFNPASRFGGASGGPVDGAVNVSVYAQGGGPVAGAFVMLSTRADTPYWGVTDENGQITLSGPDVLGPQTVTATAKDFSSATMQTVDAENITLFLTYLNAEPDGGGGGGSETPYGTIRGEVGTRAKLADPDNESSYDMAVVGTTTPGTHSGRVDPGEGAVVWGSGDYEIRSRIGDLAVVALCGVYDESTDTFDPQYMAVERYMYVSDRQEYEVDLLCDIPLDQTATVKLVNPIYSPQGPDNNRVRVWWNFGIDGFFESPLVARGLSDVLEIPRQPAAAGQLSDITYRFSGGSFSGDYAPSTQSFLEGVTDLSSTVVMPPLLDVPEAASPSVGGTVQNDTIIFQVDGPHYADFYSARMMDSEGLPVWEFVVPGDQTSIRLPDFPDFSVLPEELRPEPVPEGRIYLTVIGIEAQSSFVLEEFSYRDLQLDEWRGYSLTRWSFLMP